MNLASLTRNMLLSVILGILVIAGLSISADLPRLIQVLARFRWEVLPLILGFTLLNYGLRFIKWHFYLRVVGISNVPFGQSALIFVAGLSMVITPGKVGELLKAYLLHLKQGTPVGTTAPIIFAERLTDGLAMLILASAGLLIYGTGWQMLAPVFLAMIGVVILSQQRGMTRWVLEKAERLPFVSTRLHHLEAAMESAHQLFRLPNLLLAIGIGVISWGGEAAAFYLVLTSLGLVPSLTLAMQAAFILGVSTLIGAASMLPGGLAAAEGSLAGLILLLGLTHDPSIAAAATLLIRFATLWLGVIVGLVGLAIVARQLTAKNLAR